MVALAYGPFDGRRGPGGPGGPEFGRRGHGPGFDGDVVAGLLGVDAEHLRAGLRDGKSIADIAAERGVDLQTIIGALVDEASTHLDQAVADERLTDDEAADMLAKLTDRITARVNGERPVRDMPVPPPADG